MDLPPFQAAGVAGVALGLLVTFQEKLVILHPAQNTLICSALTIWPIVLAKLIKSPATITFPRSKSSYHIYQRIPAFSSSAKQPLRHLSIADLHT